MAGKLKADPKQFLMNHGEKLGFAVVLVLVVLGLVGTDWVPYERTPEEITEKVDNAEQVLASGNWHEDPQLADERAEYELDDEQRPDRVVASTLAGQIMVDPFRASQRLTKSIVEVDRPLTEVNYLAVEQLIASAARVYIELPPEELDPTDEEDMEGEEADAEVEIAEEDLPDELRQRRSGGGAGSALSGLESYGGFEYDDEPDYESMYAPELAMEGMYGGYGEMDYDDEDEMGFGGEYGMMYGGGAASNRQGKGYPFVSVRGVYPFKSQIIEIQDATHQTRAGATRSFQIIDFELERQELAVGSSEWGDWEMVDIKVLRDVIDSASGMEPDVVNSAVTDAVITCPLPMRVTGMWDRQATHPRLQDFVLSEAELDREMQFNRALLKEFFEEQKQLPETGVTPRGFSDMIFDSRSLQAGLMGADSAYGSGMMMGMGMGMYDEDEYSSMGSMGSGYGGGYGAFGGTGRQGVSSEGSPELRQFAKSLAEQFDDEDAAAGELEAWIIERATAEGELLLYRYLDFDVHPGYSYRYRVRLELKNPNFGAPITAVGGIAHVREGETRFTPWSEETDPVRVAETTQYFLADVEKHRSRPFPDAQMKVFQWDTDMGTVVHDELTIEMGQEIGGEERVDRINAAKQTYEEDKYTFTSNDRLVDAIRDLEFDRNEHPDLALPAGSIGAGHIVEYALVVQDERALVALNPRSQADALRTQEVYIEQQEKLYGGYKNQGAAGEFDPENSDLLEQLYGAGMYGEGFDDDEYGDYGMGGSFGGRRGRNSLRRGR